MFSLSNSIVAAALYIYVTQRGGRAAQLNCGDPKERAAAWFYTERHEIDCALSKQGRPLCVDDGESNGGFAKNGTRLFHCVLSSGLGCCILGLSLPGLISLRVSLLFSLFFLVSSLFSGCAHFPIYHHIFPLLYIPQSPPFPFYIYALPY